MLAQVSFWDLVLRFKPVETTVFFVLFCASLYSCTVIFSKCSAFRKARSNNVSFLRAFRKAGALDAVALAVEQFPLSPLVAVFEFGYEEVDRQVKASGSLINRVSLERSLQLGISEELAKLERNMNWLATVASVSPFIGLFGTVWGIIDAFNALGTAGSVSLRSVGPGISTALYATAVGLAAAIPAAIFYNHYSHTVRELGARMDDFSLEFLNVAERTFGG